MNFAKTDVVIDKSFLQGAPKDILQSLFKNQRVLMTQRNLYELLTTRPTERARCFKRIPAVKNPVERVEPVGSILRWEVKNKGPLLNIDHVIIRGSFNFNPKLVEENFNLGEDQTSHLEDWKRESKQNMKDFEVHGSHVPVQFPKLRNYRPGDNSSQIEGIQKRICTDPEYVREFYNGEREDTWPSAEHIDERWALFRWIQIRVMAALDYYRKYGEREMSSDTTKIENEYFDLEYCLVGCIVGAIATQDKGMKKRFLAICPSGKVIS